MKTIRNQILLVLFLLLIGTFASAQNKYLQVYKGNTVTTCIDLSQIDSIKFINMLPDKYLQIYKGKTVTTGIDLTQIDSIKFVKMCDSEMEVFKNFENAQKFTEELYMLLPDIAKHTWVSSFNWGDDEHMYGGNGANKYVIYSFDRGDFRSHIGNAACFLDRNDIAGENLGGYMGDRFGRSTWSGGWYGIRKCNLGIDAIENIGLMVDATKEEKDMVLGQLYFLRAFFHFQIMQYWGAMPYIDRVLGSEKLDMPRPTYHECAEKAGLDFRKAADLLPVDWDNTQAGSSTKGNNESRVNKIWALGFLGKNYLWAGSPLMTHGAGGAKTYDVEFCKKAAAAFAELLKLVEGGQTQYSLVKFQDYSKLFYTYRDNWRMPGSTEAIMRGPSYEPNSQWRQSCSYYPAIIQSGGDPERLFPAANYVNFFGMKNGKPIKKDDSFMDANGIVPYDESSGFDPSKPWKDRDPRFYSNFVFDGVKVIDAALAARNEKNRFARLFTEGDYRVTAGNYSPNETGYCLTKFIPVSSNSFDMGYDYSNALYIHLNWLRLADIYLMYAEAAAQAYGGANGKDPSIALTAVDAINKIRDRAGVGHVDAKYLSSLNEFMKEVRRERAVELAFEGHRFTDLRRWLLLIEKPYTLKTSQEFNRIGTYAELDPAVYNPANDPSYNPLENQVGNFREKVLIEREYDEKHYWLPIKNDDVYLYEGFPQNPGW
ncbi:MAG: RagB/SusD family nutrient uptake outer membrane protein [Dysgonamonadaceae bacterium]|jgi:hypothetical protein|nr:RagB/SusD family nutrient uptake outer membrane protein [Dysgonamonadaceae bacterium]